MESLEAHYRVFHKRIKAEPRESQLAVMNSFSGIPRGERQLCVLHWAFPREEEGPQLTHVPLFRVPPHQYAEYTYFGFVCHYLRYGFSFSSSNNDIEGDAKERADAVASATPDFAVLHLSPPERRTTPLVRLLDWAGEHLFAMPRDLLSRDAMVPTDMGVVPNWYHWEAKVIDQLHYKSYFSLKEPRLSMRCVVNTRVQLYHGERVLMAVSNAKLVIHGGYDSNNNDPLFNGITIYAPDQLCPVELPLASFKADAHGNRTLDLTQLAAPDVECYVDSQGSCVTVVFDAERMGTLRLVGGHNDGSTMSGPSSCALDIGMCELEYWSPDPLLFPSRYGIVGADKYEGGGGSQHQPHEHVWWMPVCTQCQQQQEAAQLILLLRMMRVDWIKEVPYFFVQCDSGGWGGSPIWEQLAVVPTPGVCGWGPDGAPLNDWWTLFWRQRAIAYCCLNPPYSQWNLAFRLIVGPEAQQVVFQLDQQYIY